MNKTDYTKQLISSMADEFQNGELDALDLYIELKKIEKFLEEKIQQVSPDALDSAEQYGKGEHVRNGVVFGVRGGAGHWDFKHVPEWTHKKTELEKIETSLKSIYQYAQNNPGQMANTETGEIPILPNYNKGKDSLILKLPK